MSKNVISVIMPVYNSEKYLKYSLCSLEEQTIFEQLEIILVDDGSTDGCLNILSTFAREHSNVVVLHLDKQGVSSARDLGIKHCKGNYIAFFDVNYELNPEHYEKLLSLAESYRADVSIVDYSKVFSDGAVVKQKKSELFIWKDKDALLTDFFKDNQIGVNLIDKLFKADLVRHNLFSQSYTVGEELYFLYKVLKGSKKVVLDSFESLSFYKIQRNYDTQSSFSSKSFDRLRIMNLIMKEVDISSSVYRYAESKYFNEICKLLAWLERSENKKRYSLYKKILKKELKNYSLINSFKYMNFRHMAGFLLMRLSPALYVYIYDLLKLG